LAAVISQKQFAAWSREIVLLKGQNYLYLFNNSFCKLPFYLAISW